MISQLYSDKSMISILSKLLKLFLLSHNQKVQLCLHETVINWLHQAGHGQYNFTKILVAKLLQKFPDIKVVFNCNFIMLLIKSPGRISMLNNVSHKKHDFYMIDFIPSMQTEEVQINLLSMDRKKVVTFRGWKEFHQPKTSTKDFHTYILGEFFIVISHQRLV